MRSTATVKQHRLKLCHRLQLQVRLAVGGHHRLLPLELAEGSRHRHHLLIPITKVNSSNSSNSIGGPSGHLPQTDLCRCSNGPLEAQQMPCNGHKPTGPTVLRPHPCHPHHHLHHLHHRSSQRAELQAPPPTQPSSDRHRQRQNREEPTRQKNMLSVCSKYAQRVENQDRTPGNGDTLFEALSFSLVTLALRLSLSHCSQFAPCGITTRPNFTSTHPLTS